MSANPGNGGQLPLCPGERKFWTNRPRVSLVTDPGSNYNVVTERNPANKELEYSWFESN